MSNKIITKQFSHEEAVDKSRHLTGFNRWARSSRILGFFMLVLEWFTIPFEVILRRDFGERWITGINFLAGFFLLSFFTILQGYWHSIHEFFATVKNSVWHVFGFLDSTSPGADSTMQDAASTLVMMALTALYLLFGTYQLFKIKWRNQVNSSLHSFDDGTSRFLWLSALLKLILNFLSKPFMILFWLLIPSDQRRGKAFPNLIQDRDTFANLCVEPGIVLILSIYSYGISSLYFFISATALFMHSYWKEMARKSKKLDFNDSRIEAEIMRELKKSESVKKDFQTRTKAQKRKSSSKEIILTTISHPNLSQIIESFIAQESTFGAKDDIPELIQSLRSHAIKNRSNN